MNKKSFTWLFLSAIAFQLFAVLPTASADVPFLRWERGMAQQIVLGGEASKGITKIQFVGMGAKPLDFQQSEKTSDNFLVFTVMIPANEPTGKYEIMATKNGILTLLGGVELSGTQSYKVIRVPRDLSFVVGIFVFLTTFASTLRAKKYSLMSFSSTQRIPHNAYALPQAKEPLLQRLNDLPYTSRVKAISGFQTSLMKFILVREGELIHRISKAAYSYMPFIGFFAGVMAANETQRAGGVGKVGITIFLTVALIPIIDAYTGILALFGFWFASLVFGMVGSLGDVLMMFAVGLGWLGPIFALSVFRYTVARDFGSNEDGTPKDLGAYIAIFTGSLFGSGIFFMSQKLVNSILVTVKETRTISPMALGVIALALIIRGLVDRAIVERKPVTDKELTDPMESISLARVNSFQTAVGIAALVFGFSFAWIENAQSALIVTALFSAPYFLLLIRFGRSIIPGLGKAPRNILIESLLITAVAFIIFKGISNLPLLIDSRAKKFLIYAGIPGIIHAIYSVICDSSQRSERVSE